MSYKKVPYIQVPYKQMPYKQLLFCSSANQLQSTNSSQN